MKSGEMVIELIQHKVWMDRRDGLFDHIAMLVDDIEAVSADLKEKGIEFEDDIFFDVNVFDKGVKYQAFRGPDGEHLEIYQIIY
jgi:4-hydroxyphenylpyruvate dioxygenase-like putative hemolysin